MAPKLASFAVTLCLVHFCWHVNAEDDVVAVFGDTELAEAVLAASVQPAALQQSDLPAKRPPYHTKQGWDFCNFTCTEYVRAKEYPATPGVMELDVKIRPVRGVNSTMMQWMWRSLSGRARYWVDNTTYPMYLFMHPVDHMWHKVTSPLPVRVGSTVAFTEFITARCNYVRNSADAPIVCPTTRTGFLYSTPPAEWDTQFYVKEEYQVSRFTSKVFEFNRKEKIILPGQPTVATVRVSWVDTPDGVAVRYQQWVGLMLPNTTTTFENSTTSPIVNKIIRDVYLNGATNVYNKNMTQVAWMQALHFIESFAPLKLWLPALWKSRVQP